LWVLALEDSAKCLGEARSYTEESGDEIVMPMIFRVRAMLFGYAIECALKGLWVKRKNKLVVNGRCLRVPGAGDHELLQLSQKVWFLPDLIRG